MTAVRGYPRLAPLIAVALMLAVAGCSRNSGTQDANSGNASNSGDAGESAQATAAGPQWSDYIPARNGRVCTYSSSYTGDAMGMDSTVNTTQSAEYTDVHEESDGTHFTVKSTTGTTVGPSEYQYGESDLDPQLTETPSLEYVLADDGTLRSEPEMFSREGLDTGFEISVDKFIVYPAVGALRQGQSHSASFTATARATDPEAQAELEADLEPGESTMKIRVDYTVDGVPPKEITTPAGTFTDTVGVTLKFDDFEFLNANAR